MFGLFKTMLGGGSDEARTALQQGAALIDVRSTAEYKSGHAKGATNIPLQLLEAKLSEYPKNKVLVFCCASGARSGSATSLAKKMGYTAFNAGPWQAAQQLLDQAR
jgi:rhodanese-related sulfurtransferase